MPIHALLRIFVALSTAVVLTACGKPATPPAPPPSSVTVVTLKTAPLTLTRELPGRTTPFLVAEVRPQVTGLVTGRLFTEGGLVKAGDALYQLDDATYRADVASADAAVARAHALLVSAQLKAKRADELIKIHAVSAQDHDNAVAALREAEANVGVAKAALQSAQVRLGYSRITAPIAGRIGKSSVTAGALVTANQSEPLATVQQLDPIHIDLSQSSSELLALRKALGDDFRGAKDYPVTILLEDGSRYDQEGKLTFADVTVDPATGSFALRVVVPNPRGVLLPGMYVRAVVGSGTLPEALLAPQQGISRDPKGSASAMIVTRDGKVEPRTVQVDRTVGDQWLVIGGLSAGDRIIVEGLQKVRPGAIVIATEAAAPVTAVPAR
ncbi:MAG: efflux RND transporter periplasmic adaptor subunit [Rhodanobacteraceae bacterium]|nr:efflux RND transporter periplasmic adaptor subunit [Rhodanobacteraceae bacterium]